MKTKVTTIRIEDLDCEVLVEQESRKYLLDLIDEFIENLNDGYNMDDYSYEIVYKDGTTDYLCQDSYDGHKIKRQNIKSILENNPESYVVFGEWEYNEYGVVHAI